MDKLLRTPVAMQLLSQTEAELNQELINDAYKPKMHNCYAQFYSGVHAEFLSHVRKTPFPIDRLAQQVGHTTAMHASQAAPCSSSQE